MKKIFVPLVVSALMLGSMQSAFAQYPDIPAAVKKESDDMIKEANRRSDSAWLVALPIIKKEAAEGKPYIPWAGRPTDLPQSPMLAFPGAEGGGSHSFGGRGGRV